jgi:ABC-type transport system involved in cytochrome bd biosynthesis fused ATPase/permease subunit
MYYHKSIDIIDEELRTTQENLKDENIHFNYKIELTNVGFHYQEKTVLSDINLTINKGEKIAFKTDIVSNGAIKQINLLWNIADL